MSLKDLAENAWVKEKFSLNAVTILGKGGNGSVFSVERLEDHKMVALKLMKCEDQMSFNNFNKEIISLYSLNHPNIVKIHDYLLNPVSYHINNLIQTEYQIFIVMEKADETLDDVLRRIGVDKSLEEEILIKIMKNLVSGLNQAHSQQIIHNDIKPKNIFFF